MLSYNIYSPKSITALLGDYNISLKKRWGQNFLIDRNIANIIAGYVDGGFNVVEIGGGIGSLSFPLQDKGCNLTIIEKDKNLASFLKEYLKANIIMADIRDIALDSFYERFAVVGNLPYYITSYVLFELAKGIRGVEYAILMMQREVANRILARSGRSYGLLSVIMQLTMDIEYIMDVSPSCFFPKPNVVSSVIKLIPKSHLNKQEIDKIKLLFLSKRKTIKNNIKRIGNTLWEAVKAEFDIDENVRAEELFPAIILNIARFIGRMIK